MLPSVVVLLLVLMVAGVVLAVLGVRGRRINDHPVCRQCAFDLDGVYPEAVTCPECGAGLKRDHSVRHGARVRMPLMAAIGVLMALTPVVPIGAVAFAALTGKDVNAYKPLWLILWEAGSADAKRSGQLALELMNRAQSKQLTPAQYERVIEACLELQGDAKKPWAEEWGDLIERAKLDGVLKPSQEQRFQAQAPAFEISTRPGVHAGSIIPVRVRVAGSRVGSNTMLYAPVSLKGASIDGRPLVRKREPAATMGPFLRSSLIGGAGFPSGFPAGADRGDYLGAIMLHGSLAPAMRMGGDSIDESLAFELPPDLAPGRYTVDVELEVSPQAGFGRAALVIIKGVVQAPGGQDATMPVRLSAVVDVLPADQPIVRPIAATEEKTRAIREALRPAAVAADSFNVGRKGPLWTIEFAGALATDEPIAYDVFLRSGTDEVKFGELTSGKRAGEAPRSGITSSFTSRRTVNGVTTTRTGGGPKSRTVMADLGPITLQSVDVVLRPSAAVAAGTHDLERYYDGEIVFEGVPVEQMPDPFEDARRMMDQMRELQMPRRRMPNPVIPQPVQPAPNAPRSPL